MAQNLDKNISIVLDFLKELIYKAFTGSIEIHFTQGGIAKIIKHEIVKTT